MQARERIGEVGWDVVDVRCPPGSLRAWDVLTDGGEGVGTVRVDSTDSRAGVRGDGSGQGPKSGATATGDELRDHIGTDHVTMPARSLGTVAWIVDPAGTHGPNSLAWSPIELGHPALHDLAGQDEPAIMSAFCVDHLRWLDDGMVEVRLPRDAMVIGSDHRPYLLTMTRQPPPTFDG